MADRSYPRDWVQTLPEESARWVRDGIISDRQREAILGLYPAQPAAERDRTVLILSVLGTLLLGAGVILFFYANWARIPAGVKVAAILAAVVGTYWTGWHLQFVRGDFPRLGQSLITLGGIFYGAAIWLIAQIFHLQSHWPTGFFLWGAGVLPVAWAAESPLMLYLATILLGIWTVSEQAQFESYNLVFPVLMLAVQVPLARRLQTRLAEAAGLVALLLWFAINVGMHDLEPSTVGHEQLIIGRILMLFGATVVAAGLARLGEFRTYVSVGAIVALAGTYLMTFHNYRSDTPWPSLWWGSAFTLIGTGVLLALTVWSAWVAATRPLAEGEPSRLPGIAAVAVLVLAAAVANLVPEVGRLIAFNILLLAGTVGLIITGIRYQSELLVNLGLAAFMIHLLTRYFDLFFEAMDKSIFFVIGGIILLGGGWLLERNRRRWMTEWGGGNHVG